VAFLILILKKINRRIPYLSAGVHPEDRPKVEQVLWADVREKRDFDGEYRLLLPDGSIKYLHSLGKCSVGQSAKLNISVR
jgi:hypothetical protein